MKRHVDDCDEDRDGQLRQQSIENYAQGVTYTYARFRVKLAIWVARHHRPFVIVEDQELCEAFFMLYSRVEIPSRRTLARDIALILDDAKGRLMAYMSVSISFARAKTLLTTHATEVGWAHPYLC